LWSCGGGSKNDESPPPVQPSSISWSQESATFVVAPSKLANSQLQINISGSVPTLNLTLSPSLQPFLNIPSQIANLQSGTAQVPIKISAPSPVQLGLVAGTIQASASGTNSTMNIYLNVWTEQSVPGFGLFMTIPPNLLPIITSDNVVYRDPQLDPASLQTAAFVVYEFQNPQDLALKDFIAQQTQLEDNQNTLPVLSPYDAAQRVEAISAPNALENAMFRGMPDYVLHDVAYIRFSKLVIVISDVSLDPPLFDQMVQTVRLQ